MRARRILKRRNSFQVRRINAPCSTAQVVDLQAIGDGAMNLGVDVAVDQPALITDLELAVARRSIHCDDPASVVGQRNSGLKFGGEILDVQHIDHTTFAVGA